MKEAFDLERHLHLVALVFIGQRLAVLGVGLQCFNLRVLQGAGLVLHVNLFDAQQLVGMPAMKAVRQPMCRTIKHGLQQRELVAFFHRIQIAIDRWLVDY